MPSRFGGVYETGCRQTTQFFYKWVRMLLKVRFYLQIELKFDEEFSPHQAYLALLRGYK